jgi:hypothetical protein
VSLVFSAPLQDRATDFVDEPSMRLIGKHAPIAAVQLIEKCRPYQKRTVIARMTMYRQVRPHFPDTLLLAREVVA